ncbi:MAG: aldo/keto reductase, partial [Armatimonadetes bacterium]|nr:aldo/keto reductase [Armatimonadota bacterium]
MNRRDFIHAAIGAISSTLGADVIYRASAQQNDDAKVPKRVLGKTGIEVSIIGLSGLAFNRLEQAAANELVREAIDAGINFVDVAPAYGNAEEVLGAALDGHRHKVFLACKTQRRTKEDAWQELQRSLKR